MAESIVSLLVHQLGNLLVEGNKLLGGLRLDLLFIKGEFERMLGFLKVADSVEDKDPQVAIWIKQVRELAQDTESVLDEYDLLFLCNHRIGFCGRVQEMYALMRNLRARSQLASEIQSIRSRVVDISGGYQRYHGIYEIQEQASGSTRTSNTKFDDRGVALLSAEDELVGIDGPKSELVAWLLDGHSQLKVLSVVGMGGLGKTTLVKRVYEDVDVKDQFQCHAWVTVSNFEIKEFLKNLIQQLYEEIHEPIPQYVKSLNSTDGLRECIKKFLLRKRYLIVFDDVWKTDTWDVIKYALPNCYYYSRVILTTRIMDVASAPSIDFKGFVYKMKTLSFEESWILFCKKALKTGCPPNLEDTAKSIVGKCGGLPLAIVAVGGILASKDKRRIDDWEMFHRSLPHELEGDGKLDRVKRILFLSFYDLPHHLKICLLYLSIFPEDYEMNCEMVIRLWTAEGFVQEREGLTIEEVGQSYLNELINKSLLQVAMTKPDGRLDSCRVHDILREIILFKSREQNFVTIVGGKFRKWPNKVLRLAIHGPIGNTRESSIFKYLHSLVSFSHENPLLETVLSKMLSSGSRLLKVLDLRGAPLERIPEEVFKLYLLRYLSMRSTAVKTISKSIGKLRNLETLDLKDTFVTELPVEILKLQRLRHLIVYCYNVVNSERGVQSFRAPYKIGTLVFLQKLSYIEADERNGVKIVTEIGKLTQLRRLGIAKLRREDGKDLCSSLEKLTNLRSLFVVSVEDDEIIDLQCTLRSTPLLLRTLSLRGRLEKIPQWIPSLQGLTKIFLERSRLKDEPLQYFGDLPNLIKLDLLEAYEGEELHFKEGKFQRLEELWLESLKGLRSVRVEKSSMPCLEVLLFADLKLMEELSSGIEHLSNLQSVYLIDMAEKSFTSLQNRANRSTQAKIFVANVKNGRYEWRLLYTKR